jgi:hypothetical protein
MLILVAWSKSGSVRTAFFSAGKVPSDVKEETWGAFKLAVRNFNSLKFVYKVKNKTGLRKSTSSKHKSYKKALICCYYNHEENSGRVETNRSCSKKIFR